MNLFVKTYYKWKNKLIIINIIVLFTSCSILLKCTSCFLKVTTSCNIEFLSDLSKRRSSEDEFINCDCKFCCCFCLRCSLSDDLHVLRLFMLSNERGLSDWLSGELLVFCKRRLRSRVALAGSWELQNELKQAQVYLLLKSSSYR